MPVALPLEHGQRNHFQDRTTKPHSSVVVFGLRTLKSLKVGRPPSKMSGLEKKTNDSSTLMGENQMM